MKRFKLSEKYIDEYCQMVRIVLSRHTMEAEKEEDLYGYFGPAGIMGLRYEPGHLEFVEDCKPKYDPANWNKYPDVEPPKGVVMLVSLSDGLLTTAVYAGSGVWESAARRDKGDIVEDVNMFMECDAATKLLFSEVL